MSGVSGAQVRIFDDVAIKLYKDAPTRVVEQGEWLLKNAARNLPTIFATLPSGYVMERLDVIPTREVELERVVDALNTSVWRYAPTNHLDASQTLLKCLKILEVHAPHLGRTVVDQLSLLRRTEDCLTHGDPTAENVMLRGEAYVIIDPLPSTEAVPDDLAVDVGKLLQSAYGWETMRGNDRARFSPESVAKHFSAEVFEMGQLWCVVHFVRTLPYVTEEVKLRVVAKISELLGFRR